MAGGSACQGVSEMIWVMLLRRQGALRLTKAEPPCWKGEINIPLWRWSICIGWQKRKNI